jgi:hypothetical protein
MTIKIPITTLPLEVQELYRENNLCYFAIDYQYNNILASVKKESINLDERWEDIEVFNFTKYLKMDNRFNTYTIELTPTEIIIHIAIT